MAPGLQGNRFCWALLFDPRNSW